MSQPLRVDYPNGMSSFVTRRIRNSQLVFVNNQSLEDRVLGALGKYLQKFEAKIYAYTIFGSHDHPMIEFKPGSKSNFFRDFGARTAEAIKKYVAGFGTGAAFERRPSEQAITADKESHLDRLMYTVLQPIAAGRCKNLSDYPGFNSFKYILSGKPLITMFFNGSAFCKAKKKDKDADPKLFMETYPIFFVRLPGFEDLSQKEYRRMLLKEYDKRRSEIIKKFDEEGHQWPSVESLRKTKSTSVAKNPKRSKRNSKRPLVLSLCMQAKQSFLEWYFDKLEKYKKASRAYLLGDSTALFPEGTCKPPGPLVLAC